MHQPFIFNPSMVHTFLRYAEGTKVSNQRVLLLIDDLRRGLSEEDQLNGQTQYYRWNSQKQKNVMICQCIMLHIQCLADISDDREPYDRFVNGWNRIAASC